MAGLGSLGANTAETLSLEVGPVPQLTALATGAYARGPVLDGAVSVAGVTTQEASQLPNRLRAALTDCGMDVEEAKWGGGPDLPSLAGKVYLRWRAHSRVRAVQHINEVAAILANVAPAFGPAARLGIQRMRIDPGPLRSSVYAYVEPAAGLPPVTCAAARETPIPSQAARTFEPAAEPALPGEKDFSPSTGGAGNKVPAYVGSSSSVDLGLVAAAVAVVALVGVGGLVVYASRRAPVRRNPRRRRHRRRLAAASRTWVR
jgi:hypothetical protein